MSWDLPSEATAVDAVPARWLDCGFRLLVLRQFHSVGAPPAFAVIEQRLLRTPQRFSRHGLSFAKTFLPEVMEWLSEQLGRPSLRAAAGPARRNPRWPAVGWHGEDRLWPDGTRTTEWFVDVRFQDMATWTAFQRHWHQRLTGKPATDTADGTSGERGAERF